MFIKLKEPSEPGLILAVVSTGSVAGKRKGKAGGGKQRQAGGSQKACSGRVTEHEKSRQAEAAKRQTEACRLAVKRQKGRKL